MDSAIRWVGGNRLLAGALLGAVAALIAAAATLALIAGDDGGTEAAAPSPEPSRSPTATATATASPAVSPTPIVHRGILDGVPMTAAEWEARKALLPLAVMLDNTPNANPHSGLNAADLVFEATVEGGITRLMAVFWRRDPEVIMPVRSARTPFVIWASELGAMYGHAGSATTENEANAGGQIVEWGVNDLNAFTPGPSSAYYRDSSRYAPYNLATTGARLRDAGAALGYKGPPPVSPWKFSSPGAVATAGKQARGIEVDFSGQRYGWQLIQWRWDATRGAYGRSQFGGPAVDAVTEEQLFFSSVVVMRVPGNVVDDSGHYLLEQFGEGEATVFTGGRAIEGTWKKADRTARTRFYDRDGAEVVFAPGPVFIEVIGIQSKFSFVPEAAGLAPLPEYTPPPPGPGPVEDDDGPAETGTPAPAGDTPIPTGTPGKTPSAPATTTPPASATDGPSPSPAASGTPEGTPTPTGEAPASATAEASPSP